MPLDETSAGPDASMRDAVCRRSAVAGLAGAAVLGPAALGSVGCAGPTAGGPTARTPGPPHAPGPPPDPSAGGGGAGTRLGAASEVPVGGGRVFPEWEVVVTQPTAGDYRGLSAICTHTGCTVARVEAGTIDCPCHGSRYHLDGTVAAGPAPRPLPARPVTAVSGWLVLS